MNRLLVFVTFYLSVTFLFAQEDNLVIEADSIHASHLCVLVERCSDSGNYAEAIRIGNEAKVILKRVLGAEHPNYAIFLSNLADCYANMANYDEAIRLAAEAKDIFMRVLGTETPNYAKTLDNLASYNISLGNYDEAIRLDTEAMDIQKRMLGANHPDYSFSLTHLANCYDEMGNYSEAIRLGTEAIEIQKKEFGTEHPYYAASLSNLATYNAHMCNYSQAICQTTEAMEIQRKLLGIDSREYVVSLNNLAGYNDALGNYKEAIHLVKEAIDIQKKIHGRLHPNYAIYLNNLAMYNAHIGNYVEAFQLVTEAMEIQKEVIGINHLDYLTSLNNLAEYNDEIGNYIEAIRLGSEAIEIQKKGFGTDHPYYAASLSNLAAYNAHLGNYPEAIRLGTEAMEIQKKILGIEHLDYVKSLLCLANCYEDIGNFAEAIHFVTEAMEIQKKVLGTEHPDYAVSLNNLALYNADIGNYDEANRLGAEAMNIAKNFLGTEHPDIATKLNNNALHYAALGDYIEAIRLGSEAIDIQKKALGTEHPDYATSLCNLATYNAYLGNYSEAIRIGTEATKIQNKVLGTEHPKYATSLCNLATYNAFLGNYVEAIRIGTEAAKIQKKVLGTEHPDYAMSLFNLSSYNAIVGNYSDAFNLLNQFLHHTHDYMLFNFTKLSANLREKFWISFYVDVFNNYTPSIIFKYKTKESVAMLYDMTVLFSKGILLNTGIEMSKFILKSADTILVARYNELVVNKCFYERQLEKLIDNRDVNTDSLLSVIDHQEMELARDSKAYGDFSRNLRITWQDVQGKLDDDDIAVEFLDFPLYGNDSTMYVALTLKKDYDSPRMIPLFEKGQLDSVPEGSLYTGTDLYSLVWKPLESELSGVKDIYFSPSGELHRIGVEYLPVSATENICDRYALHRLSSTRQLALIQSDTEGEAGVLYGDLDYDKATAMGHSSASTNNRKRIYKKAPRAIVDSLDLRGTLSRLPYTKKETEKIARDMKRSNVPYILYTDKDGSEESFKLLDGTRPRILHIATHGFYLTKQEAVESNFARPMLQGAEHEYREDKPMTRSGLLLSGCRPALNHDTIPEGVEDGILTAQEISHLDLRGLDLVVLSACQTGLGDIASGEGVFGLQRGFKSAGAKTIVMSLWKVDDNATMDLMVSFYGHYLKGMSKEESFQQAREELRQKSVPGQVRPDWAAFVMLDGE